MCVPVLRRIMLFLDGTWNAIDGSNRPTNIVRLHEALKIGVSKLATLPPPQSPSGLAQGSVVQGLSGLVEYVAYYGSGVGTGAFDRFTGGTVGKGLEDHVRRAYRFLAKHYRPGDEIHIFGFSRGAFTARSLVGYLFATGLLKAEHCSSERELQAWRHYRTRPTDRHCGDWYALKPFMQPEDRLRITTLGVFDTVGALGIPVSPLRKYNAEQYAFHDLELSSIVENSFHAVAIDEHRRSFEATLWNKPKFKTYPGRRVEQVWFPGAHADVGGGYDDWTTLEERNPENQRQDIPYEWMLQRLIDCVKLDFPRPGESSALAVQTDARAQINAVLHRPWRRLDFFRDPACRSINQTAPLVYGTSLGAAGYAMKTVGLHPHQEPICEAIHISALVLLKETGASWEGVSGQHPYRPPNLLAALPLIAQTYRAWDPLAWKIWAGPASRLARVAGANRSLPVIDWDGTEIPHHPHDPARTDLTPNVFDYLSAIV